MATPNDKTMIEKIEELFEKNRYTKWCKENPITTMVIIGSISFSLAIVLFVICALNPTFFRFDWPFAPFDATAADQYGGFLGGVFGPILGFVSTCFLIATFAYQIKTNRLNQIEIAIYKLIDYHKNNVDEITITTPNRGDVTGAAAVRILFDKAEKIYQHVKETSNISDPKALIDISYVLLFYGLNGVKNDLVEKKIKHHFTGGLETELIRQLRVNAPHITYRNDSINIYDSNEHFLGHYFRNLYNTVMVIDGEKGLSREEKYHYIKILRTQMSTPEIWLLFLNSMSIMGANWQKNKLIEKYDLIKNIPENYSTHINPKNYYPTLTFEYEEN